MKKLIHKLLNWSLLRFALVGAVNTLIGTGIMFGLYNLAGCSYWVSSAANYIFTSIISFFLNKYFTFHNNARSVKQAVKFALNIAVCYFIGYGIAKPLTALVLSHTHMEVKENVAMLVGLVICSILNYFGQRIFVFKENDKA